MSQMYHNLTEETPLSLFLRYLVPSLCGCFFSSFYVITDTMMIGHGVGDLGLTALNIMLPMFSVFMAIGYLLGVGGSVCMSVARGAGDTEKADSIYTTAVVVLLAVSVLFTIVLNLFLEPLVDFLGATESNRSYAMSYGRIMMIACICYFAEPFFQNFVKNDGDPNRAMIAAVLGNLWNIIWDYILIFPLHLGMTGAILATVMGFGLNTIICLSHLWSPGNQLHFHLGSFRFSRLIGIAKNGSASFFGEFSSAIIIYFFNIQILSYLGESSLVVYSVITNAAIVFNSMIAGVGNAVQPLISYNYGAGRKARVSAFLKIGLVTSILVAGILYAITALRTDLVITLFVSGASAYFEEGIPAIRLYFSGVIFQAMALYLANYFQSVMSVRESLLIGILRGVLLPLLLVMLLPGIFGGYVIWYVMLVTEFLMAVLAIWLWRRNPAYRS